VVDELGPRGEDGRAAAADVRAEAVGGLRSDPASLNKG
jgi:hypothetical protein